MSSRLPTIPIPPPLLGKANRESTTIPETMVVDAENFYSRDQTIRIRDGLAKIGQDLNQRATGITQYTHSDGEPRLVIGTTTGWWKYNIANQNWDDITDSLNPLTAGPNFLQSFRVFQKGSATHLLGVNGTNSPKKWNGSAATYSAMGGSPPTARTIMTLANRVILGNLSTGGTISTTAVDVSAFNDFDSGWGSVLVALLADTPGPIVAMQEMSSLTGAIWKSDALYYATAQGTTAPFRFDLRLTGIAGPVSVNAVFPLQDGTQLYLANDYSIKVYDGAGVRHFGVNGFDIQRHIRNTADSLQLGKAFGFLDKHKHIAWFYYVGSGADACNLAVAIDLSSGAFWPMRWTNQQFSAGLQAFVGSGITFVEMIGTFGDLDPALTFEDLTSSVPRAITCEQGGQNYVDVGLSDDGVAIPFFLETGLRRATPNAVTVTAVEHLFRTSEGSQNVTAKIGISQAGELPVFDTGETMDIGAGGPYLSQHRQTGKLIAVRLEGSATKQVEWRGADAAYATRGRR